MAGLIVKNLNSMFGGYDRMIDIMNKEISTLTSEVKLANNIYMDALIDRNHLFRECRRLRTENNSLRNKLNTAAVCSRCKKYCL